MGGGVHVDVRIPRYQDVDEVGLSIDSCIGASYEVC